jgi:hypothetical protein
MPASVEYKFPVEFTHTIAGPVNDGTGSGLTVTAFVTGVAAVHPLVLV